MKKAVMFILIAVVVFSGIYVAFKREFDQFNPFYKQNEVYVIVDTSGEPEGKGNNIRYRYNLTGYTEQGREKRITFSASSELEQGTYVKVLAKGAYTKKWMKVKSEDVPAGVLEKVGGANNEK